jgi:hypothetical protein
MRSEFTVIHLENNPQNVRPNENIFFKSLPFLSGRANKRTHEKRAKI